jgi:Tol biopolymer transport system component
MDPAPDWSPNGKVVVYSAEPSDRWGSADLFTLRVRGELATQLTNCRHCQNLYPDWSPDGSKILFNHVGPRGSLLIVMNSDGTGKRALLPPPLEGYEPAWAPDGKNIVFVGYRYASGDPLVLDISRADGSHVHLLTAFRPPDVTCGSGTCDDTEPDWSPDGQWIVFQNGEEGAALYLIHPDGTGLHLLVHHGLNPEWSPDGSQIAFRRGDRIWIIRPDGSDLRRYSKTGGADEPTWQPRPPA